MTENIINGVIMNNINLIVTHDGVFHADEVTSVALLRLLYKEAGVEEPQVLRTRRPNHLRNPANLLVDVGGVYDPEAGRFDHHLRDLAQVPVYPGTDWRMSSAGMIWQAMGLQLIRVLFEDEALTPEEINVVFERFQRSFITPIDLADNGQTICGEQPVLTFSALISAMNPTGKVVEAERSNAFMKATDWTITAIKAELSSSTAAVQQRSYALSQLERYLGNDILVMYEGCPWIGVVNETEESFLRYGDYKVAIFPDLTKDGEWRIQSFPGSREDRFAMRCKAPANLMEAYPEIPWVFVHPAGFIGGVRGDVNVALAAARAWIDG